MLWTAKIALIFILPAVEPADSLSLAPTPLDIQSPVKVEKPAKKVKELTPDQLIQLTDNLYFALLGKSSVYGRRIRYVKDAKGEHVKDNTGELKVENAIYFTSIFNDPEHVLNWYKNNMKMLPLSVQKVEKQKILELFQIDTEHAFDEEDTEEVLNEEKTKVVFDKEKIETSLNRLGLSDRVSPETFSHIIVFADTYFRQFRFENPDNKELHQRIMEHDIPNLILRLKSDPMLQERMRN